MLNATITEWVILLGESWMLCHAFLFTSRYSTNPFSFMRRQSTDYKFYGIKINSKTSQPLSTSPQTSWPLQICSTICIVDTRRHSSPLKRETITIIKETGNARRHKGQYILQSFQKKLEAGFNRCSYHHPLHAGLQKAAPATCWLPGHEQQWETATTETANPVWQNMSGKDKSIGHDPVPSGKKQLAFCLVGFCLILLFFPPRLWTK